MLRRFFSVVPKTVQIWAPVLAGCAPLMGLIAGYETSERGAVAWTMPALGGGAFVVGCVLAIWLLCLGFVFADARRRAMRAVAWVLVAALFPHLLGFLLYFVLRQPIASICNQCGKTVAVDQPFCSWCGASLTANARNGLVTAEPLSGGGQ